MTIKPAIRERCEELGFNEKGAKAIQRAMEAGHIWILNDSSSYMGFVIPSVTIPKLQAAKLWPK